MNLILFDKYQEKYSISSSDQRYLHIRDILKMAFGDELYIGVVNKLRYKARIIENTSKCIVLQTLGEEGMLPHYPIKLLVGLPRPQTARKILQTATTLGVAEINFFLAEKSEPSYANSKLWTTDEYQRHLIAGAEQAFATTIPQVKRFDSLASALSAIDADSQKIALDNYEAIGSISEGIKSGQVYTLAFGPERGWSGGERLLLGDNLFTILSLGPRALRLETAITGAVAIVLSSIKLM